MVMENIEWTNSTPEQRNFWNLCNGLIAWNQITPLYYDGLLAGSEFGIYIATKLYMAFELNLQFNSMPANATPGGVNLMNLVNVSKAILTNNHPVWNTTTAAVYYCNGEVSAVNVWFSRLTATNYQRLKFNGYRLDII
jgi:hypothetical protein